jgi:hypothetical protein
LGATGSDATAGIVLFPLSSFSPPVPDERERIKRKEERGGGRRGALWAASVFVGYDPT